MGRILCDGHRAVVAAAAPTRTLYGHGDQRDIGWIHPREARCLPHRPWTESAKDLDRLVSQALDGAGIE